MPPPPPGVLRCLSGSYNVTILSKSFRTQVKSFSYWIETIGGIDIVMNSKCPPKYITSIKGQIPDYFYYELFYTWFTVKQAVDTDRKQLSYLQNCYEGNTMVKQGYHLQRASVHV